MNKQWTGRQASRFIFSSRASARNQRYVVYRILLLLVLIIGMATSAATRVEARPAAPTFTVNYPFDVPADLNDTDYSVCRTASNNSICTLRAAIMKANRFAGGGATIIIPAGAYTLTVTTPPPNDDLIGDLNITQTTTIIGAGMNSTFVDGGAIDRVFRIVSGTVTISNMTVRDGEVDLSFGGGIANFAALTLTNVHLTRNFAVFGGGFANLGGTAVLNNSLIDNNLTPSGNGGGGIDNESGTLIVNNSVIANNRADGGAGGGIINERNYSGLPADVTLNDTSVSGNHAQLGAGIFAGNSNGSANLTLNRSTINANSASQDGGGIYVYTSTLLTINNSTLSANSAQGNGGGIMNFGSSALFFVTIAGNIADSAGNGGGAGAIENIGSAEIRNSLLGENYVNVNIQQCGGLPINSQDYNYSQDNCGFTGTTTHNLTGGDPLLGPLQNNGGETQTRALFVGSIVTDQIPSNLCRDSFGVAPTTDQRNVQRPINGLCDMGAYEGSVSLPLFNANLIRNGDAEDSGGYPTGQSVGFPNWVGVAGVVPYGAPGGFPTALNLVPQANGGFNFFSGAYFWPSTFIQQIISIRSISAAIDTGQVKYNLSGYFGGYLTQDDHANLVATFLNTNNLQISVSPTIGDVNAAGRGNATELLFRNTSGLIPNGTRSIMVRLTMANAGSNGEYTDAYADNLSLVLQPPSLYLPLILR
jgi:hypothetical protein